MVFRMLHHIYAIDTYFSNKREKNNNRFILLLIHLVGVWCISGVNAALCLV